jgi:hypothetical protein
MLNERKLTENEIEQRKIALKGLLKNKRALVQKYGADAEKVMYGIATKQAKKKVKTMNLDKLKEIIQDALTVKEASPFVLAADAARDAGKKEFEFPEGSGKMHPVTIKKDIKEDNVDKFLLKDLLDMVSIHAATAGLTDQDAAEELLYAIGDAFNLGVDVLKGPKLEENIIKEDKQDSIYELNDIMEQLYELSNRAKSILREDFPSEYTRLDAYGALDFGTSGNRYDVTFEKALETLGSDDEDEDYLQENLNPEVTQKVNQFIKGMAKRYGYSEQDAVFAIMAALKQRKFDGLNENLDVDEIKKSSY